MIDRSLFLLLFVLFININFSKAQTITLTAKPNSKAKSLIRVLVDSVQYLNKQSGICMKVEISNKSNKKLTITNPIYDPYNKMRVTLTNLSSKKKLNLNYSLRTAYNHRQIGDSNGFPIPFKVDSIYNNNSKLGQFGLKMAKDADVFNLIPLQKVTLYLRINEQVTSVNPMKYNQIPAGKYLIGIEFLILENSKYVTFEQMNFMILLR